MSLIAFVFIQLGLGVTFGQSLNGVSSRLDGTHSKNVDGLSSSIVDSVSPAPNANGVLSTSLIEVVFSQAVNPETISNTTIRLIGSASGRHLATFAYNNASRTSTITPITPFASGETVTVIITRGILSDAGDSIPESFAWAYKVGVNSGSGRFGLIDSVSINSGNIVAGGDWNKDGRPDFIVFSGPYLLVFQNCGDGVLKQTSQIYLPNTPTSIVTGDWNNDGALDFAVASSYSNSISVYMNNGMGIFTLRSTATSVISPGALAAGDWNGDGFQDISVSSYSSKLVTILLNDGNGTFTPGASVNVESSPQSIISGDWNGDGFEDLAVVTNGTNSLIPILNNGRGLFTLNSPTVVGNYPICIVAGDWNEDGYLDLAVSNYYSNTISILLNNTAGGFTQKSTVSVQDRPQTMVAQDWNGDGVTDLAVLNAGSGTISILINNGEGVFTQSSSSTVGGHPQSMLAADWIGNGTFGLAAFGNTPTGISFLLNRPHEAMVSVSRDSINYGVSPAGTSEDIYLKVTNLGVDSLLDIYSIVPSNAAYKVDRSAVTIPPGQTDSILVEFSPMSEGVFTDSISIRSNDARNPVKKIYLSGYSGTYVSGVVTSNTTWSKDKSPYIVNGNMGVDIGVALTIQHGVTVVFNGPYSFNVDGTLQSDGTVGDSVVFTSDSTETKYPGITLRTGGTGNLSCTKIAYATTGITAQTGSSLFLRNSRVTNCTTGAAVSTTATTVTTSTFNNSGVGLQTAGSGPITVDSVWIYDNNLGVTFTNIPLTLRNSHIIRNNTGVSAQMWGGNLTIVNCDIDSSQNSGVDFTNGGGTLNVQDSRLIGNGLVALNIGSTSGRITGSKISGNGNGIAGTSTNLVVQNNEILSNLGTGIQTATDSSISYNTVAYNGGDGLKVSQTPVLIRFNRIYANNGYNLKATLQTVDSINARDNYWGAITDADVSAKIYDYYDDGASVRVLYKPYFTKPVLPPAGLRASSVVGRMTLRWIKGSLPENFLRYRVYGGVAGSLIREIDSTSNPNDTVIALTGLLPATTYSFRLTVVDSTGLESDFSNEADALQLPLTQVAQIDPSQYETGITTNPKIAVKFGFDVAVSSLNDSSIVVAGSLSGKHQCAIAYNASTWEATVTPSSEFLPGELVTVTLTRGIKNSLGESLTKPFSWSFTTSSQNASMQFTRGTVVSTDPGLCAVVAGDWNRDGRLDLAALNSVSCSLTIYQNEGDGALIDTSSIQLSTTSARSDTASNAWKSDVSIITGDWNGDGIQDLAIGGSGMSLYYLFLNQGSGKFAPFSKVYDSVGVVSLTSADWNGDGSTDIAAINGFVNPLTILMSEGNGGFVRQYPDSLYHTYSKAISRDWNLDGSPDIALASFWMSSITVFPNDGAGIFGSGYTVQSGHRFTDISAGDWNRDGLVDIAALSTDWNGNYINILRNNGDGTFSSSAQLGLNSIPRSMVEADFNGDGWPDIAISRYASGTIDFLVNNGDGTFTHDSLSTDLSVVSAIAAGDYDGDGTLDLALIDSSRSLSLYLNHLGPSSVATAAQLPTRFALYQNYPNPFNPSTNIEFDVARRSFVNLSVYDVLGRRVRTLVEGWRQAGTYNVQFNASTLPSGVYFYRLNSGDFIEVKKLMLIK